MGFITFINNPTVATAAVIAATFLPSFFMASPSCHLVNNDPHLIFNAQDKANRCQMTGE
jgi:hypothetical protein